MNLLMKLFIASLTFLPFVSGAQEVNLSTTVTGNQEQPKVLYIIPWQNAERSSALELPLQSALDDVFALVDRDELARDINTLEHLLPQTQSPTIVED